MDLQNSNGSSGADKQKPSLIDLGTFYVDADIIFGFTSHLLKRKAKVESCSSGESSFSLELSPRKRLSVEEERCASRPPPEGAGAVSVSESDRQETRADLCKQCQMTIVELRRQALALADPSSLKRIEKAFGSMRWNSRLLPLEERFV
ncbi:putative kinesin-like protein KIF26A [Triplophysa rosa]|uniref:Kinesin-like protein KIF26A n=1 Tax=Triplophysa rosa TaxID=992332 RepID=A0A9W7TXY6_TRIRA|nr:putative kinesin-like protein KIF26A [Triplophysa rosa]